MYFGPDNNPDDDVDIPPQGPISKWLVGIAAPVAILIYAINILLTNHGIFYGNYGQQYGQMEVTGPTAKALGLAALSLAIFLHCHYFWGNIYHLSAAAVLGKILSLTTFIASAGYLICHIAIWGR